MNCMRRTFCFFFLLGLLYGLSVPFNCHAGWSGNPVFSHIGKDGGLLQEHILCITEDSQGYLWFGTYAGLHRFDGLSFDYYVHNDTLNASLTGSSVFAVLEDSEKRLWVGTSNGLSLYQPQTNNFKNFNGNDFPFTNHDLREIVEDNDGFLWIATYGGGIARFDPQQEKIVTWYTLENGALTGNFVNTLFCDGNGTLWVGMEAEGLFRYDKNSDRFEPMAPGLSDKTINTILERKGKLWIGTWRGGLSCFDPFTGSVKNFSAESGQIPDNTVRDLAMDPEERLWLATTNGLGYFDPESETVQTFRKDRFLFGSITFNYLWSILLDREGILWIGTFGNGINKLDANENRFSRVKVLEHSGTEENFVAAVGINSRRQVFVAGNDHGAEVYACDKDDALGQLLLTLHPEHKFRCFFEDSDHYIWLGAENGVMRCSPDLSQTVFMPLSDGLKGFNVYMVNEDQAGNIWFGGWNTGLLRLPAASKNKNRITFSDLELFSEEQKGARHVPSNIIWSLFRDSQKRLWVGSGNTALLLQPDLNSFKVMDTEEAGIFAFAEYPAGVIWFGTAGRGLVRWKEGEKKKIYKLPGAPNTTIHCLILMDGKLWMGTGDGLFAFDLQRNVFNHFTTIDGLPSETFVKGVGAALSDSTILMGTTNGLVRFSPYTLSFRDVDPELRISDIALFNESISLERAVHSTLKTSLDHIKELVLNYDDNVLSISFSAIRHSLPEKTRFIYRLEGFNDEWFSADASRKVSYTNLNPGEYDFQVRAQMTNGDPGKKMADLRIVILPPWWRTVWFRIVASVSIVASVVGFFFFRTRSIRRRNRWLSDQVQERTTELQGANQTLKEQIEEDRRKTDTILGQQKELLEKKYELEKTNETLSEWNAFQKQLIAILGHDMRGPLARFTGLIDILRNGHTSREEFNKLVSGMYEAADSISTLSTDLLSWVTLRSRDEHVESELFTWKELIEKVKEDIGHVWSEKNITLTIHGDGTVRGVLFVARAALRNVLLNAIHYSDQGGMIEIEAGLKREGLSVMSISDHGKGFDAEKVNRLIRGEIFKGVRTGDLKGGAGLGLSICYDMLQRTGGMLEAVSQPGAGGTFLIFLPLAESEPAQSARSLPPPEKTEKNVDGSFESLKGKKILLIDDDDELRWTLAQSLGQWMEIHEARSAEDGMEYMMKHTPDLVIIDIHMKGISGIDFCRKIKTSPETAHLPCMVISGDTSVEARREALAAGAETFMTKPFQVNELLVGISAYFLNQEKKLKRFFLENAPVDQITDNSLSRDFLNMLIALIEEHLASPELNVDFLAKELGVSKSTLYRNLKTLTGRSAVDFIKTIRMRKSLALIKEGKMNISEIATHTGFNSPSYFTTTFKKYFGFSPKELKTSEI